MMGDNLSVQFLTKWHSLGKTLGLNQIKSTELGEYLHSQYSQGHRHYHGIRHILSMEDHFENLRSQFRDPVAAELAIFFHDVIYDPAGMDNEEQSEFAMRQNLTGLIDVSVLDQSSEAILTTKRHLPTSDSDTNLILDLDMSVLGQSWSDYERYAYGIMQEFIPVYGEEAYRKGRIERFLEPTIARGKVFVTEFFRQFNEQSMRNMRAEREILRSGASFRIPDPCSEDG